MISFSILPLLLPPLPVFRLLLVCCSCCFLLAVATSSFSHYGVCYEIVCEYYPFLHESIFVVKLLVLVTILIISRIRYQSARVF
jgi:hypothetical protein